MRGLETVDDAGNRARDVRDAEMHQFLVHEIDQGNDGLATRKGLGIGRVTHDPGLAVVGELLAEREVDGRVVVVGPALVARGQVAQRAKVLAGLDGRRGPESLEVLDGPRGRVGGRGAPLVVFPGRVKQEGLGALARPENGRAHAGHEPETDQFGPEAFEEVEDQTLDVTAVEIGVGQDEDAAVPQPRDVAVLFAVLQSENLLQFLNFLVLENLLGRGVAHVEEFAAQRVDAEEFATDDGQAGDRKGLGRISLGQDQGRAVRVARARARRVLEFGNAADRRGLGAVRPVHLLLLAVLGRRERVVHDAQLGRDLLEKILRREEPAPETRGLARALALGLRRERGIDQRRADEDEESIADHRGLDGLVLFVVQAAQALDDAGDHVIDVRAALGRRDAVDEGRVLKSLVLRRGRNGHVPPLGRRDHAWNFFFGSADEEIDVGLECLDGNLRAVAVHFDLGARARRRVPRALADHRRVVVVVEARETEPREIGTKRNLHVPFFRRRGRRDLRRMDGPHVVLKDLAVLFAGRDDLDLESRRINVGQFGAQTVLSADDAVLRIVVIAAGQ